MVPPAGVTVGTQARWYVSTAVSMLLTKLKAKHIFTRDNMNASLRCGHVCVCACAALRGVCGSLSLSLSFTHCLCPL